ncbi:MAG TPA: arsenosugar biosynthesis radical SAM (seleno)protein ArsS [Thermodesulfobacteriota bacterium]|nr:arsenosugar biosynthesis radical SAM (seleno)protein ArsS [Thermodesulfobacteriota bacterium]
MTKMNQLCESGVAKDPDLNSEEAGPKPTKSLRSRHLPLASPKQQIKILESLDLSRTQHSGNFSEILAANNWGRLTPTKVEIFQINVGKLCNMTCRHCHVDSGPDRVEENMHRETIDACLHALDKTEAHTVDITGGAPELNPHFRYLIEQCISRGKHVIDRCNLTILLLPRFRDLPEWFAERGVEIVCSLPHYRKRNTDAQRGDGTYEKSIEALRRLNAAGYGKGDPNRILTLVSNPAGAYLAGNQTAMEREWKAALQKNCGVAFDRLITINNMPISRFLEWLEGSGNLQSYMELLVNAFNPTTVNGLMCRNTLSVSWDGRIFDCDFNQMLDLESQRSDGHRPHIRDFDPEMLAKREIVTGRHCFGCTAGAGSSCGGAIDTQ